MLNSYLGHNLKLYNKNLMTLINFFPADDKYTLSTNFCQTVWITSPAFISNTYAVQRQLLLIRVSQFAEICTTAKLRYARFLWG